MKPPRTFLAAPETQRLGYATCIGEPPRVGKSVIGDVCSALRKAALMRARTPVYVFPNSGLYVKDEGRWSSTEERNDYRQSRTARSPPKKQPRRGLKLREPAALWAIPSGIARKKDGGNVLNLISSAGPRFFRRGKGSRKCRWTGSPKVSLTIVQKDSDGPVRPRCRNDDIEKIVAVYIA